MKRTFNLITGGVYLLARESATLAVWRSSVRSRPSPPYRKTANEKFAVFYFLKSIFCRERTDRPSFASAKGTYNAKGLRSKRTKRSFLSDRLHHRKKASRKTCFFSMKFVPKTGAGGKPPLKYAI